MRSERLRKYVEWLEWLLGTCEESPRSSLGDNGRWRPAGLYFVHMIHFTRIQAAREWRISTSVHLLDMSDSKPAMGANSLEHGIKGSLRPFVALQVTFGLGRGRCGRTHRAPARTLVLGASRVAGWLETLLSLQAARDPPSFAGRVRTAILRTQTADVVDPRIGSTKVTICV